MPGAYTIDEARSLVLSRGWGVLRDRELLAHARALAANPRFRPHFSQLTDFREATGVDVTTATVREMAELSPFGSGARRALVAPNDLIYGMARMFQIMRSGSPDQIDVFRELDSALEWLGFADAKAEVLAMLTRTPPDWSS
jgi:hypothetical protein